MSGEGIDRNQTCMSMALLSASIHLLVYCRVGKAGQGAESRPETLWETFQGSPTAAEVKQQSGQALGRRGINSCAWEMGG